MVESSHHFLPIAALAVVSWLQTGSGIAAETGVWENSQGGLKEYRAGARELNKTDTFNIWLALKRAVKADSPGDEFHWRNTYTLHSGSITLQKFTQPRDDGTMCAEFTHSFDRHRSKRDYSACSSTVDNWRSVASRVANSIPKKDAARHSGLDKSIVSIRKYTDEAQELSKTDAFNVRVALRRALDKENPGEDFHWRNSHTQHRGTITLTSFIEPRGSNKMCADFIHVYYFTASTSHRVTDSVCRGYSGPWQLERKGFSTAHNPPKAPVESRPLYNAETVYKVQGMLTRLSYAPGPVDGLYGNKTRRAITYFQRDENLPVTGKISKSLLTNLRQSLDTLENLPTRAPVEATPTAPQSAVNQTKEPKTVIVRSRANTRITAPASAGMDTGFSTFTSDTLGKTSSPAVQSDNVRSRELHPAQRPYLLTIDGIDFTLIPEARAIPIDHTSIPSSYLKSALITEWKFAYDWQHVPWSGTYADISKNVTRVKSNIHHIYRTAREEGRYFVVAAHSWGGVLAYRAISELFREGKLPVGAVDVLVTMGSPLNAQYEDLKSIAANYGRWRGTQALAKPVKAWLNYWVKEDDFSGAISGITNTRLAYNYDMRVFPHNSYHQTAQFKRAIEWDVKTSLENLDQDLSADSEYTGPDATARLELPQTSAEIQFDQTQ